MLTPLEITTLMKSKLLFTALTALILTSGCEKPRYEFHSNSTGTIIWRCDQKTGQVDWAIPGGKWQRVE